MDDQEMFSLSSSSQSSTNSQISDFHVDWNKCEVQVMKGGKLQTRSDFSMDLLAFVEAGKSTGYLAKVQRQFDGKTRMCYFTTDDVHNQAKFLSDINSSFGSGGMASWFREKELPEFIHFLKKNTTLPVRRAATVIGRQPRSNTWVLSPTLQMDCEGNRYTQVNAPYVWINPEITDNKFKTSLRFELCPVILDSDQTPQQLIRKAISLLEVCLKHNFLAGLLTLGAAVQSFHYETIANKFGGCSVAMLKGVPETGKSLCLKTALSLFGAIESGYFVKGTNAYFMERSSECSIPYVIDDPNQSKRGRSSKSNFLDVEELVVDMYNRAQSANATRGSRTPISLPLLASNFEISCDSRYTSFDAPSVGPVSPIEEQKYAELSDCFRKNTFSSSISWFIKVGTDLNNIPEDDDQNQDYKLFTLASTVATRSFPAAQRLRQGWAGILYFTFKMLVECDLEHLIQQVSDFMQEKVVAQREYKGGSQQCRDQLKVPSKDIIFQTLEELGIELINGRLNSKQIKTFMKETTVDNEHGLAVYTPLARCITRDVNVALQHYPEYGLSTSYGIVRDFLRVDAKGDTIIRQHEDTIRHRVVFFYSKKIPQNLLPSFKKVLSNVILQQPEEQEKSPTPQERDGEKLPTNSELTEQDGEKLPTSSELIEQDGEKLPTNSERDGTQREKSPTSSELEDEETNIARKRDVSLLEDKTTPTSSKRKRKTPNYYGHD